MDPWPKTPSKAMFWPSIHQSRPVAAYFLKERRDFFRPDVVAGCKRMEVVVHHHALGERAIRIEEPNVEIVPDDPLAVGEILEKGVDPVFRNPPRVVGRGAAAGSSSPAVACGR